MSPIPEGAAAVAPAHARRRRCSRPSRAAATTTRTRCSGSTWSHAARRRRPDHGHPYAPAARRGGRSPCSRTAPTSSSRTSATASGRVSTSSAPATTPSRRATPTAAPGPPTTRTASCPPIGELDLHLIGEGRHEQLWTALGAHTRELGGVVRARPSRSGRRTPAPSASSATSTAGTAPCTPCATWARRASGSSSCPGIGVGHDLQVRHPGPRRRLGAEGRPDGALRGAVRRRPHPWSRRADTSGRTATGCAPRRAQPARRPDERLRAALRQLAARARLPRSGRRAHRLRRRPRATRTSSSCRWPSIRSADRGATRSPATTPRPAGSARPTTCAT